MVRSTTQRFCPGRCRAGCRAGRSGRRCPVLQALAQRLGVVGTVGLDQRGLTFRRARQPGHRGYCHQQRQQLGDVMAVGAGQDQRKGNALGAREEEEVLAGRTTAIGWVRSTFFPAPAARMEELSATAREKPSRFAPRSSESSTLCRRRQAPQRCQSRSRRQQVMPEPQPISLGSLSQGMPERSTNRMPVSARRSSSGLRPVYRLRLRFFGSSGSMCAHNSSSINGFGIRTSQKQAMPYRTKSCVNVQASFC